ncbi:MAG: hypothetical protein J6N22_04370, partial [Schwartzia sp.]|nr:hypothetical protein [Schwartzia sp. (in: firmicutes)]
MAAFVNYGKSIHADFIHFMKLNSWGHITEKDFIKMDVYDERNVNHKAFVEILRDPIFLDPHVHVDNIDNFIGKGGKKMTGLAPTMENFHRLCREKETVVFCAGEYCMRFLNRLDDGDVKRISFIVDNDAEKQGTSLYGIPVKHPEEIQKLNPKDTLVVIAVENSIPEIYKQIADMGSYAILPARILINDILSSVAVALYENQDKTAEVAALLYDETSRRIYKEAIRRRMLYG